MHSVSGQGSARRMLSAGETRSGDGLSRTVDAAVARLRNVHDGEAAIPEVVAWGDIAIPRLESLLRGPSDVVPHARCWAADALAGIGSAPAVLALIRALRDSSARILTPALSEAEAVVSGRIAEHLSVVPGESVSEALIETLREHPASPSCVVAVGRRREPRALALLAGCLFEDSSRQAAREVLRSFDDEAVPHLLAAVLPGHGSEPAIHIEGRRAATELLGEWLLRHAGAPSREASQVLEALQARLCDPWGTIRLAAAIALSHLAPCDDDLVARLLVSALGDADWSQVETLKAAIGRVSPHASGPLLAVIADGSAPALHRARAIQVVTRMNAPGAVALLASLDTANDGGLRLEAIRGLGRMSSVDPLLLIPFLTDPVARVRRTAFAVLWHHHALAIEHLMPLLADADRHIRRRALSLLLRHPREALPLLRRTMEHAGSPARGLRARWRLCREASILTIRIYLSRRSVGTAKRRLN